MAADKLRQRLSPRGGFTLVELMVSTAIMLIVILVLLQVIAGMTNIWHTSAGNVSNYQNARAAFTQMTRTLSRATLKTYVDYVDSTGAQVSPDSGAAIKTFNPASAYARASELQFICGPSLTIDTALNAVKYPGDCVFFEAPTGIVVNSNNAILSKSLNILGYYVEYSDVSGGSAATPAASVPSWLPAAMGITATTPSQFRYRLIQYVQQSDTLGIYGFSTATTPTVPTYSISYTNSALQPSGLLSNVGTVIKASTAGPIIGAQNILAENIPLLIIRPRLEPQDEIAASLALTGSAYNATNAGAVLSPTYCYDSRAWMTGSTGPVAAASARAGYERNQLPPIVDVAMIAMDPNSIVHFGSANLPNVAISGATTGLFSNSANMDADLDTYGQNLAKQGIRFRIFRAAVQLEGSAWINSSK